MYRILMVSVLATSGAWGFDNHNLRIHNAGDHTIQEVHISGVEYRDWGPDLLGSHDVIDPGESYDFNIVQGCDEDIKLVYRDGDKVYSAFDTCKYDLDASY